MDYTDVATLEKYGGFTNTSEDNREELGRLIAVASAMIDKYCGRVFAIATDAAPVLKTYSSVNEMWNRGPTLWLLEDLQAVYSIPTLIGSPTITYLPDQPPYDRLYRDDGSWEDPTTILGYWAFSMTTPVAIEQACLRLALSMFPQVNQTGERFEPQMPSDVKAILDPYRRRQMP